MNKPNELASTLYNEGMAYNLSQSKSPAAASIAKASFSQAATLGHTGAMKALANMEFEGVGGAANQEHALLLMWSAYAAGDGGALEELSDLLESYAEGIEDPKEQKEAFAVAQHISDVHKLLSKIIPFMRSIATKGKSHGNQP